MRKFISNKKLVCLISLALYSSLSHAKRLEPNAALHKDISEHVQMPHVLLLKEETLPT